jgi:hypothetical protein
MIPRPITVLAAFVLSFSPAAADTFNINVSNGESTMLLLTVTDMSSVNPKEGGAFDGSINNGQMLSVHINGDSGGNGHIQWKATTPDRQKCGSGDVKDLSSGSNITVNTPSSC